MVTPAELLKYAEVMRDMGLSTVALGGGVIFVRGDTAPGAALDPETQRQVEAMLADGPEPADPRDNPMAYPDGRVPEFPSFDTTDTEEPA